MNEHVWHLGIALLMPAAALSWRHSRLVSVAIAFPLIVNLYVTLAQVDLAVEHPARVLIPAISAAFGFAEAYAEGRHGKAFSAAWVLGNLTFSLGVVDIAALFLFAVRHSWIPPLFSIAVCVAIIIVSTAPKGKLPWLMNSIS